jgi:glycosyltransferase involved in cell wall biosynthesis
VRILHAINQVSGRAGAEVSLRDIVTHTADQVQHAVVVLKPEPNVLGPFEAAQVPCYVPSDPGGSRLADVRHVRAAIRDFHPDLVHTSLFDADLAGRLAAALERVPVVSSFVNTPYGPEVAAAEPVPAGKRRALWLLDRVLARHLTNGFHAISHATAEHAVTYLAVSPRAIRVVPRGRSRELLGEPSPQRRVAIRQQEGWADRPLILNVAREEPQKGQWVLLEALPRLLERRPDTLLVIAGRAGRSSERLDARITALGIEAAVQRLGVRGDVADLLSAADVFAFPSLYEGLGGAAVEALGLGLPVVASDVPALRELVGEDRGWLVPTGDVAGFATAIDGALTGGEEVRRRARAARVEFDRSYELQRCIQGMLELYRDIEAQLPESGSRRALRRPRFELSPDAGSVPR